MLHVDNLLDEQKLVVVLITTKMNLKKRSLGSKKPQQFLCSGLKKQLRVRKSFT